MSCCVGTPISGHTHHQSNHTMCVQGAHRQFGSPRCAQCLIPHRCLMAAGSGETFPWDNLEDDGDASDDGAFDEHELQEILPNAAPSGKEGQDAFAEFLTDRYRRGVMSAHDLCLIAYWATCAGAQGFVTKLAKGPGAASGHYSRHLRKLLEMDEAEGRQMILKVPGHSRHEFARVEMDLPCVPPHELLHAEVSDHPELIEKVREEAEAGTLPPMYTEHPVVRRSGFTVLPLILYIDAVPTTRSESLLGFWVYCLLSDRRHLVLTLRKTRICKCGCRGWCSLWPVFRWLHWSFSAMANARFPDNRPDAREWHEDTDATRSSLAGLSLCFTGAVIAIKGDWAEYAHTLAFPSWASADHPCPWCDCRRDSMGRDTGLSPVSFPFRLTRHQDYIAACTRAEVHVVVRNIDMRRALVASLHYDCRRDAIRGRCLLRPVPELGLHTGDRLEPSPELPDIARLETTTVFPIRLTFWRRDQESLTKHRNPLFDQDLGLTVSCCLVDVLHAMFLGVVKHFSGELFWSMLLAECWAPGLRTLDEKVHRTVGIVSAELSAFYDKWRVEHPGYALTPVQDFSVGMAGTQSKRKLRLKASEGKGFFFYLLSALRRRSRAMPRGALWLQAAEALDSVIDMMRCRPLVLEASVAQDSAPIDDLAHPAFRLPVRLDWPTLQVIRNMLSEPSANSIPKAPHTETPTNSSPTCGHEPHCDLTKFGNIQLAAHKELEPQPRDPESSQDFSNAVLMTLASHTCDQTCSNVHTANDPHRDAVLHTIRQTPPQSINSVGTKLASRHDTRECATRLLGPNNQCHIGANPVWVYRSCLGPWRAVGPAVEQLWLRAACATNPIAFKASVSGRRSGQ